MLPLCNYPGNANSVCVNLGSDRAGVTTLTEVAAKKDWGTLGFATELTERCVLCYGLSEGFRYRVWTAISRFRVDQQLDSPTRPSPRPCTGF